MEVHPGFQLGGTLQLTRDLKFEIDQDGEKVWLSSESTGGRIPIPMDRICVLGSALIITDELHDLCEKMEKLSHAVEAGMDADASHGGIVGRMIGPGQLLEFMEGQRKKSVQ